MTLLLRFVICVTLILLTMISAAAEDLPRSIEEWLETTRKAALESPSAKERSLLLAAAMYENQKVQKIAFNASVLDAWMEQEGKELQRKLLEKKVASDRGSTKRRVALLLLLRKAHQDLKGGKLPKEKLEALGTEDKQLLALYRGTHDLGMAAMKKGYTTGKLTAAEYEAVCDYALSVEVRGSSSAYTPSDFKVASPGLQMGKAAPLFAAQWLDSVPNAVMGSPHNIYDSLTAKGALEMLQLLAGYQPSASGVEPRAETAIPSKGKVFHLKDLIGKKPVLLVLAHPSDYWAWHFTLAVELEAARLAWQSRVETIMVNVSVHDSYMGTEDPFDPLGEVGTFGPGRRNLLHPTNMVERARAARLFQMALPFHRMPMVLDNMGQTVRDAYRDRGGEATFILLDLAGNVVYWDRANQLPQPQARAFYSEWRWQRLQLLSHRIADLLAKEGRDSAPAEWKRPKLWKATENVALGAGLPDKSGVEERVAAAATVVLGGIVKSVDIASNTFALEVGRPYPATPGTELWEKYSDRLSHASQQTRLRLKAVERWRKEGAPQVFQVARSTLLMKNGEVAKLADLKAGNRVGVRFRATRDGLAAVGVDLVIAMGP